MFIDALESEDENETSDGSQNGGNDSNTTPDTDQETEGGDGNTDGQGEPEELDGEGSGIPDGETPSNSRMRTGGVIVTDSFEQQQEKLF